MKLQFTAGIDFAIAEKQLKNFVAKATDAADTFNEVTQATSTLAMPIVDGIKGVMDAGAQMENFQVRLETLTGSTESARLKLQDMYRFAAETPFNVDEVVNAEATLRGFAGVADQELLPRLMDFASALNTDVSQSAIDLGKAWSQGATGLESDTGKILRKQVADLKGWSDDTKVPIAEFRNAMLEALDINYGGGAERASKTFQGMFSTLQDEWTGFQRSVADAGLFDEVKAGLAEMLELIGENRTGIQGFAEIISEDVYGGIKGTAIGVAYLVDGVSALGTAFGEVYLAVLDSYGAFVNWAAETYGFMKNVASMGGRVWTPAVEAFGMMQSQVQAASDQIGEMGASYRKSLDSFNEGNTALNTTETFFSNLEERAKDYATEVGYAHDKGAAGADHEAASQKALAKAKKEAEKNTKDYADALADIDKIGHASTLAQLRGIYAIKAARDDDMADIQHDYEVAQAALDANLSAGALSWAEYGATVTTLNAHTAQAWQAVYADAEQQIAEARKASYDKLEEMASKADIKEVSRVKQLQKEKILALADFEAEVAQQRQDGLADEEAVQADRARIIAGYNEQIQAAQFDQAAKTLEDVSSYTTQIGDVLIGALDDSYQHALDTANALTEQLAAGEQWYTAAQEEELKRRIEAQKRSALRAFYISKGLKLAEATVNVAAGVTQALGSAPPPLNFVNAGVTAAAGAIQLGTIAAEQPAIAHRGAFVEDLQPDETMIKATRKEVVLSPVARDQFGDQNIQRAQAGQSPRSDQRVLVVDRYRHDSFNRFAKDNLQMQGPMSDAVGSRSLGINS